VNELYERVTPQEKAGDQSELDAVDLDEICGRNAPPVPSQAKSEAYRVRDEPACPVGVEPGHWCEEVGSSAERYLGRRSELTVEITCDAEYVEAYSGRRKTTFAHGVSQ
jgi:hypothetical protein